MSAPESPVQNEEQEMTSQTNIDVDSVAEYPKVFGSMARMKALALSNPSGEPKAADSQQVSDAADVVTDQNNAAETGDITEQNNAAETGDITEQNNAADVTDNRAQHSTTAVTCSPSADNADTPPFDASSHPEPQNNGEDNAANKVNDNTELDEDLANEIMQLVGTENDPTQQQQQQQQQIDPSPPSTPMLHPSIYDGTMNQQQSVLGLKESVSLPMLIAGSISSDDNPSRMTVMTPSLANIPRIPSPCDELKQDMERMDMKRNANMTRYPAPMLRMSKTSMSTRADRQPESSRNAARLPTTTRPASNAPGSRPPKLIRWDVTSQCRPPLTADMDSPHPCSYSTHLCRPLRETVAPSYTFGRRTFVEKPGGSRTAWYKTWFQSSNAWQQKADFTNDRSWPSPVHYPPVSTIGHRQLTAPCFPSFSIGMRKDISFAKKGSTKEPSPGTYDPAKADGLTMRRHPMHTHGKRTGGCIIGPKKEVTPSPNAYCPRDTFVAVSKPSFTIRGNRGQFYF